MIGIDSNALLRWVAPELGSPEQAVTVARTIDGLSDDIFVNPVVLAESLWVLGRRAGIARSGQVALIRGFLDHPRIVVAERERVAAALAAFETGGAGFADRLIGALNAAAGCRTTFTFDKTAAKGPHFTLLD